MNALARTAVGLGIIFIALPETARTESNSPNSDSIRLPPVVVSAGVLPIPKHFSPAGVTVITREEIEAHRAQSVVEVLNTLPGVHIDQQNGGPSSAYIRGAEPNYTLVLLDGIPLNDSTNSRGGSYDLSALSMDAIEKIEIVRGAASNVYGPAAMAGVIQISTRRHTGTGKNGFRAASDTRARVEGAASSAHQGDGHTEQMTAWYADSGQQIEDTTLLTRGLAFHANQTIGAASELSEVIHLRSTGKHYFPDDSGGSQLAVIDEQEASSSREVSSLLRFRHRLKDWWDAEIQIPQTFRSETIDSPGVAPGERDPFGIPANDSDSTYSRVELKILNQLRFSDTHSLTIGGSIEREEGWGNGSLNLGDMSMPTDFDLLRHLGGLFFDDQFMLQKNLFIQSGLRLDVPEFFGTRANPSLGLSYRMPSLDTVLFGRFATGYKLPSMYALGNAIVGNPDLLPERSETFELGVRKTIEPLGHSFELSMFRSRFYRAIDFDEGPPPQLLNRNSIETEGFELEGIVRLSETLTTKGNLTYVAADVSGSEQMLRNRPRWRGAAALNKTVTNSIRTELSLTAIASVHDSSIPTGDQDLGGYLRADATTNISLDENLWLSAMLKNISDRKYYQAIGTPAAGITFLLSLNGNF